MKLLKAMATVAGSTFISRIVGFVRDILMAAVLGAGAISDAFFVALKIPNLFRRITAEGAFSVSFIPIYAELHAKEKEQEAALFSQRVLGIMLAILVPFTVIGIIAMPYIIMLLAPGFSDGSERSILASEMARITFPYLLFASISALLGGILNTHNRFFPFSFSPVLFNATIIGALLFLVKFTETAGHAVAWGVFFAGIAQIIWLLYFCVKANIQIRVKKPEFTPNIKKLFRLMGPGVIGAGVVHISIFADMIFASLLPAGSISHMYYADRLYQLPLGVIGIAIGTALLPMLSKSIQSNDKEQTAQLFNQSLLYGFALGIPAALALMVMPWALITVLFERGVFEAADSLATSSILSAYAVGLPAFIVVKVLIASFHAQQDTKTPVKIAVFAVALNVVLNFILFKPFGAMGIAIATSISGWTNALLLWRIVRQKKRSSVTGETLKALSKICMAALVMGAVLYGLQYYLADFIHSEHFSHRLISLIFLMGSGFFIYLAIVLKSNLFKIADLKTLLRRK